MVKGGVLHRGARVAEKAAAAASRTPRSFAAYEWVVILAKNNYENECRLCTQKNLGRVRLECRKTYTITLKALYKCTQTGGGQGQNCLPQALGAAHLAMNVTGMSTAG